MSTKVEKNTIVRLLAIACQPIMEKWIPEGMPMQGDLLMTVLNANQNVEATTVDEVPQGIINRDGATGALRFGRDPQIFLYWTRYPS